MGRCSSFVIVFLLLALPAAGSERRRIVEPTFPSYQYLQWSCFIAADHQADIATVQAYILAHGENGTPVILVEAMRTYLSYRNILEFIRRDHFCDPPDVLQFIARDEARDCYEALKLIVLAADMLKK